MWRNWNPSNTASGNIKFQPLWKTYGQFLKNLSIELLYDYSSSSTLGYIPKRAENRYSIIYTHIYNNLICNNQIEETT